MSIVTQTLSYRCAISGTGQDPGTQEQKGNTCLLSITNPIANTRPQACSKYTQTSWTFALPPAPTQGLVLAPPRGPGSSLRVRGCCGVWPGIPFLRLSLATGTRQQVAGTLTGNGSPSAWQSHGQAIQHSYVSAEPMGNSAIAPAPKGW